MSGSITDPAVFDPTTGTFVTAAQAAMNASQTPALNATPGDGMPIQDLTAGPGQANASWNPLRAMGHAILPALVDGNPDSTINPPAASPASSAPPQSAPAAPPAALPGSGPDMGAQLQGQSPEPRPAPPVPSQSTPAQAPQQEAPQAPPASLPGTGPEPITASPQAPAQAPASPPAQLPPTASGQRDYAALLPGLFTAESGNRDVKNPVSSASGPGQMLDSTFEQFIKSPANTQGWTMADKGKAAAQTDAGTYTLQQNEAAFQRLVGRPPTDSELQATWFLGADGAAKLVNNPNAPIDGMLSADAIKLNPTILKPGMTGAEALAATAAHFAGKGGSPQVAALAPTDAAVNPTTTPAPPGPAVPPSGLPGVGANGLLDPASMDLSRFQSTRQDKMFALAAGLLGAPSLGQGLGKGLGNLNALNQGDRQEGLKTYSALLQSAQANAKIMAMMRPTPVGSARMDPNNPGQMLQSMKDGTGSLYDVPVQGVSPAAYKAPNQDAATAARGQLTSEKLSGGDQSPEAIAASKANIKGLTDFSKTEATARTSLQNGADVLELLNKSGGDLTNPDFASKIKRYLAENFNVDVGSITPSGLALAQKDIANLANNSALTMTHGTVPRSQAEMATIQKGFGQPVMNSDALKAIIQSNMAADQRTVEAGDSWRKLEADPDAKKQALAANSGLFTSWLNRHLAENAAVNQNITGQQGSVPTPQIQQTAPGAPFTHRPPLSSFRSN